MRMQRFVFPTHTSLIQARQWVETNYPYLTVTTKPNEFTLLVESLNSITFDKKIEIIMNSLNGTLTES